MVTGHFDIPYKYGDTIRLKPIFDVHWKNKYCDSHAFREFLSDSGPNTYFIGGGDLMDSIITTDKRYRKSVDDTEGDDIIDEQIDTLHDILSPYKERTLGLGLGNHENTITKKCGTNPIKRLCEKLNVPFLGYSALLRLKLSENGNRGRSVIIRMHHGWGGGSRTRGANITKYERDMGKWDADIYLYGHVHQKQYDRMPRLGLSGDRLIAKPQLLVICGSFLKTLSLGGDPTYSEEHGFPPTEIGGVTICIKPTMRRYDLWVEM